MDTTTPDSTPNDQDPRYDSLSLEQKFIVTDTWNKIDRMSESQLIELSKSLVLDIFTLQNSSRNSFKVLLGIENPPDFLNGS